MSDRACGLFAIRNGFNKFRFGVVFVGLAAESAHREIYIGYRVSFDRKPGCKGLGFHVWDRGCHEEPEQGD